MWATSDKWMSQSNLPQQCQRTFIRLDLLGILVCHRWRYPAMRIQISSKTSITYTRWYQEEARSEPTKSFGTRVVVVVLHKQDIRMGLERNVSRVAHHGTLCGGKALPGRKNKCERRIRMCHGHCWIIIKRSCLSVGKNSGGGRRTKEGQSNKARRTTSLPHLQTTEPPPEQDASSMLPGILEDTRSSDDLPALEEESSKSSHQSEASIHQFTLHLIDTKTQRINSLPTYDDTLSSRL